MIVTQDYPRNRLAKLFKMKKRSPKLKLRRASYNRKLVVFLCQAKTKPNT